MSPELQPMAVQYYCHVSPSLYHVTSILHCHLREFWSHDTDVNLTYICFGIILTVLFQFLETGTFDTFLIDIVQLLRISGFSL